MKETVRTLARGIGFLGALGITGTLLIGNMDNPVYTIPTFWQNAFMVMIGFYFGQLISEDKK